MIFTTLPDPDSYFRKSQILSILHRTICVFSAILAAWYFLLCILSFADALDDMHKFEGLGFSYPLQHYLRINNLGDYFIIFVSVTAEFLFYICQYCRAERKKTHRGNIGYFTVMLAVHIAIWMHGNILPERPVIPINVYYHTYAKTSLLPSFAYFALYLLRVRKQNF